MFISNFFSFLSFISPVFFVGFFCLSLFSFCYFSLAKKRIRNCIAVLKAKDPVILYFSDFLPYSMTDSEEVELKEYLFKTLKGLLKKKDYDFLCESLSQDSRAASRSFLKDIFSS